MNVQKEKRLSLRELAIFSSPVLVFQALELPWRIYLPSFFSDTVGLPLAMVAGLMMWIRLFDMAADPLVGWLSDRTPTRFGLRRPWMAAAVPLIMLGTWQVFMAVPGTGVITIAAWCLVMHLGYTLMVTPHGGWGLEISSDYHERTRVMGAKVWFALAGMPFILLLPSIGERWFAADRADQMALFGWALIILAPLSVWLVIRTIPEPIIVVKTARAQRLGLLRQCAALLSNHALLLVLALYALVGLADAAGSGTFLFFVEVTLRLKGWGSVLLLAQAMVGLISIPLWAVVSRRIGKQRALMGIFAWQAVTAPLALFLPAGELMPLFAYLLLRNLCWGGDYMLLRAMAADIAGQEADERGVRNGGSYYALFNVSMKLSAGLGIGIALWMLASAGFAPNEAGAAGEGAQTMIRWVYALPSCLCGMAGVLILGMNGRGRTRMAADAMA